MTVSMTRKIPEVRSSMAGERNPSRLIADAGSQTPVPCGPGAPGEA